MNNQTEDSEALFGGSRRVPVVIRAFEDALGHMVGMAEVESDGVNMVARITLDHNMVPRLNTVLAEFAKREEQLLEHINEVQLQAFESYVKRVLREEHAKFEWREQYGACPCGCGGIYDPPITKEIDDV